MRDLILGLHHVTATVDEAQPDVDCYADALAMRLVKKTVNFDNPTVYHLYYGDRFGTPGTLMTTFPYAGWGVRPGVQGAGQVTATAFSVPENSLSWWAHRLRDAGYETTEETLRFGKPVLSFRDPSGLLIELAEGVDPREPWLEGGVDEPHAVRGVSAVTMSVRSAAPSVRFLTEILGWNVVGEEGPRTRLVAGDDAPGHQIDVLEVTDGPSAVNGLGTVHHVAMAVADDEAQAQAHRHLMSAGVAVTDVRDRQYFRSIYFREPGGILYEIATLPPGFAVDEDVEHLGRELKLPPWEEPRRAAIEQALAPLEY